MLRLTSMIALLCAFVFVVGCAQSATDATVQQTVQVGMYEDAVPTQIIIEHDDVAQEASAMYTYDYVEIYLHDIIPPLLQVPAPARVEFLSLARDAIELDDVYWVDLWIPALGLSERLFPHQSIVVDMMPGRYSYDVVVTKARDRPLASQTRQQARTFSGIIVVG